jgi:hypothetical protein
MQTLGRNLVCSAAIVALVLTCIGCGSAATNVGVPAAAPSAPTALPAPTIPPVPTMTLAPTPAAAPTKASAASPEPLANAEPAAIQPGQYTFAHAGPGIAVTVPSGWVGNWTLVGKDVGDNPVQTGPVLFEWPFDHGFKDPCADHTPVVPPAGSGAAGLLSVIAGQPGIHAGRIVDRTVGGHAGKSVDYTVTADPTKCGNGQDGFWIWGSCPKPVTAGCEDQPAGDRFFGVAKGDRERLYAVDVDGKTYTFFTNEPIDLAAADRAELQHVIDSIQFLPAD